MNPVDLVGLSDAELWLLHERIRDEGIRRGWGEYWQEGGVNNEIYDEAQRLKANESGSGRQLREARKAANLTQQKLAELADCSIAYIRVLEGGYAPDMSVVLDRIHEVIRATLTREESRRQ